MEECPEIPHTVHTLATHRRHNYVEHGGYRHSTEREPHSDTDQGKTQVRMTDKGELFEDRMLIRTGETSSERDKTGILLQQH